MSSYLSKSKKAFKPKAPLSRLGPAAGPPGSTQSSIRGSVDRQTQTPQPPQIQPPRVELLEASAPSAERGNQLPTELNASIPETTESRQFPSDLSHLQAAAEDRELPALSSQPTSTTSTYPPIQPPPPRRDSSRPQQPSLANGHQAQTGEGDGSNTRHDTQHETDTGRKSLRSKGHGIEQQPYAGSERTPPVLATPPPTQPSQALHGTSDPLTGDGLPQSASRQGRASPNAETSSRALSSGDVPQLRAAVRDPEPQSSHATAVSATGSRRSVAPQNRQPRRKAVSSRFDKIAEAIVNDIIGETDDTPPHTPPPEAGSVITRRAKRKREVTPEEFEASQIAPTVTTMNDLTKDTRLGKKSSRHRKLLERDRLAQQKKLDAAQEQARRQAQGFMDDPNGMTPVNGLTTNDREDSTAGADAPPSRRSPSLPSPTTRLAPRVRLVNGQIVQDEESRLVDRHAAIQTSGRAGSDDSGAVSEDELTRRVNSGTYMRRERHAKWTPEEAELFYEGLRMFGTDFMTISKLFPGRTRRQIKLKFNKEERDGPQGAERVRRALQNERRPADLDMFQRISGFSLKDPDDHARDMEADRRQLEDDQAREAEALRALQLEREARVAVEAGASGGADAEASGSRNAGPGRAYTGDGDGDEVEDEVEDEDRATEDVDSDAADGAAEDGNEAEAEGVRKTKSTKKGKAKATGKGKAKVSGKAKATVNGDLNSQASHSPATGPTTDPLVDESSSSAEPEDNTAIVAGRTTRRSAAAATAAAADEAAKTKTSTGKATAPVTRGSRRARGPNPARTRAPRPNAKNLIEAV